MSASPPPPPLPLGNNEPVGPPDGQDTREILDSPASAPPQIPQPRTAVASHPAQELPPAELPISSENTAQDKPPTELETSGQAKESISQEDLAAKPTLAKRLWLSLTNLFPKHERSKTPAFLVSLIFHVTLMLVLVLVTMHQMSGTIRKADFSMRIATPDDAKVQTVEIAAANNDLAPPSPEVMPLDSQPQPSNQTPNLLSDLLAMKQQAKANTQVQKSELQNLIAATQITTNASFSATGVKGRDLRKRQQVALANGGTLETEKAVEEALRWLANHQRPNGSWSLLHNTKDCGNECPNEGCKDRFDTAATGLALLAFLGAGYTHRDGEYRETVRRGVYFLMQVIEITPQGGSFLYQCERGMYNHGIAAFALCEAYQLTGDPDLKKAAQQCVDFIVSAQNYAGGWGYLPKKPGDLTLSGWQIMALKSAYSAKLEVPAGTILKIDSFLDTQQMDGGTFFGYTKPGKSPTCTAIGLLIRLFRGMTHTDPRILDGVAFFHQNGPSNNDVYHNYYVTLFLFHVGGHLWDNWNARQREFLLRTQSTSGHSKGSWYFDNAYGKEGGRLYSTAMCAMTLEVYYRYSPLYKQVDEHFEL